MPRVKRSVHARKKRRKVLEQAKGYWGLKSTNYKYAKEQVERSLVVRLPRPQGPQARVPQALDHAHQRRRPRERAVVQPVHRGAEGSRDRARPEGARRSRGRRPGEVRRDGRAGESRAGDANSPASGDLPAAGRLLRRPLAALRRALPPARRRPRGSPRSRPTSTGTSRCACSARCTTSSSAARRRWDDDRRRARRARRLPAHVHAPSRRCRRTRCSAPGRSCPAFLTLADGRPLDLLELGPSAGLNLVWDRYALPLLERRLGAGALELAGDDRNPPPAELLAREVDGRAAARDRPEPGRRDDRARRAAAAVVRLGRPGRAARAPAPRDRGAARRPARADPRRLRRVAAGAPRRPVARERSSIVFQTASTMYLGGGDARAAARGARARRRESSRSPS